MKLKLARMLFSFMFVQQHQVLAGWLRLWWDDVGINSSASSYINGLIAQQQESASPGDHFFIWKTLIYVKHKNNIPYQTAGYSRCTKWAIVIPLQVTHPLNVFVWPSGIGVIYTGDAGCPHHFWKWTILSPPLCIRLFRLTCSENSVHKELYTLRHFIFIREHVHCLIFMRSVEPGPQKNPLHSAADLNPGANIDFVLFPLQDWH